MARIARHPRSRRTPRTHTLAATQPRPFRQFCLGRWRELPVGATLHWLDRGPSTTLPPLRDGNFAQDDRVLPEKPNLVKPNLEKPNLERPNLEKQNLSRAYCGVPR